MKDYMIHNIVEQNYTVRLTLENAKAYIQEQLDKNSETAKNDFVIYKRERIDA